MRTFIAYAWLLVFSVLMGAALVLASPSKASPADICAMLDRNPTPSGLIDTVAAEVLADDLAPSRAAEVVVDSVIATCPRHVPLLRQFAAEQQSGVVA